MTIRGALECGIPGIVREDLIQQEEDPRFDTKLWPLIFSLNPEIPLVTDRMTAQGAIAKDIHSYIQRGGKSPSLPNH